MAAAEAKPDWLRPGGDAVLCGLAKFPKLNGKKVQVFKWIEEKERWKCIFPDGKDVNVFTSNLQPAVMTSETVGSLKSLLEAGRIFEVWREVEGNETATPEIVAQLDAKIASLSEIPEGRLVKSHFLNRGQGYRAAKAIKRGEVLLSERALCSEKALPPPAPKSSLIARRAGAEDEDDVVKDEADEAPPDPIQVMSRGEHRLVRVLQRNVFECTREPGFVAYFPALGGFNHSCAPSAFADTSRSECTVRATRDIAEGEEVCLSYIPVSLPLVDRRAKLRNFGFLCVCPRCEEESSDDPSYRVPCQCGESSFSAAFSARMNQECSKCSTRFDREKSKNHLAELAEASKKQEDALQADAQDQWEKVWAQLRRLSTAENLLLPTAPHRAPPLHDDALTLVANLATLQLHVAKRMKGEQRANALQAFIDNQHIFLERFEERHGHAGNRDPAYLRSLRQLATEEIVDHETRQKSRERLVELCLLCFGQPDLPPTMLSGLASGDRSQHLRN